MGRKRVEKRAHRTGKQKESGQKKRRTIVVKFLNYKDKEKILDHYKRLKLWNERIYLNDYSERTIEKRKILFAKAKELRSSVICTLTVYIITPAPLKNFFFKIINDINSEKIRILHINIRSLSKNNENFRHFLEETKNIFNIICVTETWCSTYELEKNSNFHLKNFELVSLERQTNKRGGGVLIYVKENFAYKVRIDLSVSDEDKEIATIELIINKGKNILISSCYRPPDGACENFSSYLQRNIVHAGNNERNKNFIIRDFNMDCFIYNDDKKVRSFYDEIVLAGGVPLINHPTRVTKNSATLIDNIFTTDIINKSIQKGIIKTDLLDHFPIFLTFNTTLSNEIKQNRTVKKRIYNDKKINDFKHQLSLLHWGHINFNEDASSIYNKFFETFYLVYDANFPVCEKLISHKTFNSPWIAKGLKKSSKIKQKLYIKYLKTKSSANEKIYKNYKNLFEKIRKNLKKNYYSNLINKFKNNSTRTWKIIKEITGKSKNHLSSLPQTIKFDNVNISEPNKIAYIFNKFFTEIGTNLSKKIPTTESSFEDYLCPINKSYYNNECSSELSQDELDRAFKSLKRNNSIGADEVSGNIVIDCYESLKDILYKVFNASIKQGVFPDQLKIAKVIPIYKQGDKTNINNYRPISVLSTFSKLLERIIYNRIFKYFDQNNILYTKHYLSNRKQFVTYNDGLQSDYIKITCGVPQSSILGPLMFLIYVNDLSKAANLRSIMFADDTNLFLSNSNINELFSDMNKELKCVSEWFKCNKLTLNLDKTKYILFHPISKKRFLPTTMPKIVINELEIKREAFTRLRLGSGLGLSANVAKAVPRIPSAVKNIGRQYNDKLADWAKQPLIAKPRVKYDSLVEYTPKDIPDITQHLSFRRSILMRRFYNDPAYQFTSNVFRPRPKQAD
ncbi:uncharacterized protein LOC136090837 [Hydra vulgaris]|uniref:Uncharacterized protein LOC136090837 n=1 Tax=Hydra vulgaris TaxID=6087 RepID=A0ABM4DHD7_HYDVU